MTKRATFTQAELDRCVAVAVRHGAAVKVERGVIYILAQGRDFAPPLPREINPADLVDP